MSKRLIATGFVAAALLLPVSGLAFAQTQNSTDAGKHEDPDAASDVRQSTIPLNPSGPAAQSQDAGKRNDPDAESDARQQALAPHPQQQTGTPATSTDAGKHEDPDAASDAQEPPK